MRSQRKGYKMHSSIDVANYFLKRVQEDKRDLTPLQLMKLVFLSHGWMLGVYWRHFIKDPIEAWEYGPIIPNLYNKIKQFKSSPVNYPIEKETGINFDAGEKEVLDQVYREYGKLSGIQLSSITHVSGSPWENTWERGGRNSVISNDLIMEYYREKYRML